ncbi:MAG: putative ATP-binding protein involved in virulence [Flavobacterium sp.]|jgi:predicted ATP-binding protein involved in virulence
MKTYIEKIIIVNRAPFNKIELDFQENEIAVLTAINGSGKTTILSHIVDAWYEMIRPHFPLEFENKENKYYRISSPIYNLDRSKPSFVYIRFRNLEGAYDYLDIRNNSTELEYSDAIKIEGKIPFSQFSSSLSEAHNVKITSSNFSKQVAEKLFLNNISTYFPSYRFEAPGYLNEPYKVNLDFKKLSGFSGYLKNPLEVITGLPQLANWIMDIVLDMSINPTGPERIVVNNLNEIITKSLISKNLGQLRFGFGNRGMGSTRIQIVKSANNESVYPTIFNLSSGESSIFCLFGELLKQADNYQNNIPLNEITGIVLIDEVDKHLHIKLQKEVLPRLFDLFPNVQFILSSHSPFLSMGLAEEVLNRTKIVDLDNFGISTDPTSNELYQEVYNMMISENSRFKNLYQSLSSSISEGNLPLIITEGKTDAQHIKKAKEVLKITDCECEFYEITENWGDSRLKTLLEQLSKVEQSRKIIGVFDRDVKSIVDMIEMGEQVYKDYTNNVYALCIPTPEGREGYSNISIEFYYSDEDIRKEKHSKRLYFDNEVDYLFNKSTGKPEVRKLATIREDKEFSKKIFDEDKICEVAEWVHSKANFANLIENDIGFIEGINFSQFSLIFDRIKLITNLTAVQITGS